MLIEDQIIHQFLKSSNVLLLPSSPADGDSLGSALALYLVFQKLGKKATVISSEPVPKDLRFLPMIEKINGEFKSDKDFVITVNADVKEVRHEITPGKVNIILTQDQEKKITPDDVSFSQGLDQYDLVVVVDTADLQQLGKFYEKHPDIFYKLPVINIDHHASNFEFGTLNHVQITASATTEIMFALLKTMEEKVSQPLIDADVATLLLAGIITDTGSFQHSNTTPQAFLATAELLKRGARQQEIIKHVYKTKSLSTLRLWGQVLSKIQFAKDYHFVWSTISQKDIEETGAEMEECGGIIDELLNNAPGAEIVALLKEKQPGLLSASLRSTSPAVDANEVAALFGGGGHKQAAGFRIKGKPFDVAAKEVLLGILAYQAQRHGLPMPQLQGEKRPESNAHSTGNANPNASIGIKIMNNDTQKEGEGFYRFEN